MTLRTGSLAAFAHALLLAGVATVGAQQPRPARNPPPRPAPLPTPRPVPTTPPPTTAPPPGPAALSVPDPFAGLRPGPRDLYQRPDGGDRFQHLGRYRGGAGSYFPGPYYNSYYYPDYYSGYYPGLYDMPTADTYWRPRAEVIQQGRLVLQTEPDAAQVFVDGYYAGVASEFGLGGRAMDISAGHHRIELRAAGYETLAFSVMVEPNDTVRYRGDLQPLNTKPTVVVVSPAAASAASQTTPAARKNFYVIPNCYAGDKPPSGALPKGCDVKKLETRN
jgi:hypothetical protein